LEKLEQQRRFKPLTLDHREAANDNVDLASRYFLRVLYVRMFIFHIFLQCASSMAGGLTHAHKSRWLLLQVAPSTLLEGNDVFLMLTMLLNGSTYENLQRMFIEELLQVQELLKQPAMRLFNVLDEAQITMDKFSNCFLSQSDPVHLRPILRPLVKEWTRLLPNIVIAGTGLSMQDVEDVFGSAVAKEDGRPPPETITDIGAFDAMEDQRDYLEKYLPPGFLDSEKGKPLASRLAQWLHGRCVRFAFIVQQKR
jgi:hypothetical protein